MLRIQGGPQLGKTWPAFSKRNICMVCARERGAEGFSGVAAAALRCIFPGTDTCSTIRRQASFRLQSFPSSNSSLFRRRQASFRLQSFPSSNSWLFVLRSSVGGKLHSDFSLSHLLLPGCSTSHLWLFIFMAVQLPIFDFLHRAPMADAFSLYLSTACTGNQKFIIKTKWIYHIGNAEGWLNREVLGVGRKIEKNSQALPSYCYKNFPSSEFPIGSNGSHGSVSIDPYGSMGRRFTSVPMVRLRFRLRILHHVRLLRLHGVRLRLRLHILHHVRILHHARSDEALPMLTEVAEALQRVPSVPLWLRNQNPHLRWRSLK